LHADVSERQLTGLIAPLTLQVIIENSFTQNIVSRNAPLYITITSSKNGHLLVQNNVQLKSVTDVLDFEAGLDNLVKKYELMGAPLKVDDTKKDFRTISVPLFEKEEVVI
jgi:two-component system, LytTR family, sensor kinase